ncbi:hypothetical protein DFJ63DRAFT_282652 [Scheffersomyces coipomensis]|uniref:uncharacterized protein n=1 Tax=Scheffersomyces coipomensis TaxID=1788519 RepID=UPI00315DE519
MATSASTSTGSQSTSWTSFLKSLATFNGDLYSLTAPPFILAPISLIEYSQYWSEHPELLVAANHLKPAEDAVQDEIDLLTLQRQLAVTKWFIATLRSQYCSRSENLGGEKNPLNPTLGEVFVGKWDSPNDDTKVGETILVSEQVSHHPPMTAYSIINKQNETYLQGYNGIRATISATSINVKQFGHALLEYKDLQESYLITLPPLHIEGLISASPFVELEGTSYIQSSNGYITVIEYSGRGYFSGKKNSFKARIYKDQISTLNKENAIITINGQWSDKSYISRGSTTPHSKNGDELFYDAQALDANHVIVKPLEEQHELESRKIWDKVAEAIKKGEYETIYQQKSLIENNQRDLRKKEQLAGINWETRWFDLKDYEDWIAEDEQSQNPDAFLSLTSLSNLSIHNAPSGSLKSSKYDEGDAKHWRFNLNKWEQESEIKI